MIEIMNAIENAKRIAGNVVVNAVMNYITNGNVERKIDDLFNIAFKLAWRPCDREYILQLISRFKDPDCPQKKLLINVFKSDQNWVKKAAVNFFVNSLVVGRKKTLDLEKKHKMMLPFFLLIDPTERCNYRCKGCWAGNFEPCDMPYEVFDRLLCEAKELGIYFVTISGGEPFLYRDLFKIMERHPDMTFHFYTNGSLLADEKFADRFVALGNGLPCFSLEGFEERTDERRGKGAFAKVMKAMDNLRERKHPFGISCTATSQNYKEITSDEFVDTMIKKGAMLGWYFMYMPIGRDPDFEIMLTPEQRKYMWQRTTKIRNEKPIVFADFWNDGPVTDGCLAGGRRYVHITADCHVEPCAFVHFNRPEDSVREKSLLKVLEESKLFNAMRARQNPAYESNPMRPCWIVDRPWALRDVVKEVSADASEAGSIHLMDEKVAGELDRRAKAWEPVANEIWESIQNYNKRFEKISKIAQKNIQSLDDIKEEDLH